MTPRLSEKIRRNSVRTNIYFSPITNIIRATKYIQIIFKLFKIFEYLNQGLVKGAELCLNPYFFAGWSSTLSMLKIKIDFWNKELLLLQDLCGFQVFCQPFISRKFPWINSGWEDVCCDPAGAHLLSVHGRAWLRLRQNLRCSGGSDTAPLLTLTPAQLWVVTTISCTQQIFMSSECQVMKWLSSKLN